MKNQTTKEVIALGNGQLGLMLGKAAKRLGVSFEMFSLAEAWEWLKDANTANTLVTFEQEHVNEELLEEIQKNKIPSFPTWKSFLLLRSKRSQKAFLKKHGFPTADSIAPGNWDTDADKFLKAHKGGVLKAGKGGYDGRGVWILDETGHTKDGIHGREIWANAAEPYLEAHMSFESEIASVVCRSVNGNLAAYPTVKSIQREGVCFQVEYTKEFSSAKIAKEAAKIAEDIAKKLDYVGVLAVEFFMTGNKIIVNEIAPRVHNSGHFTIDVCAGSQFENHLRAGLGLPLESIDPSHPAALMVNLLWPEAEKDFATLYAKLTCGEPWPENVKLHWYGKSEIRPNRKMGHFTVYGESISECREAAEQILATRWA